MIQISNITFGYKAATPIYDGFSLDFKEGGVYGLLGKNGTGKSTLLYLISGLLRQQHGTIFVDGADSRRRSVAMLRDVFIVPEEFDLPDITLEKFIRTNSPFYPRFSREVIESSLADFGLSADVHLGTLSMGQKKKVYVSFALATRTHVLLMDEPTNGLDIPSKSQFRKVVASNMADDSTVIISTHQVHDVESLLDHVVVIGDGHTLLDASMAELSGSYRFEVRKPGDDVSDALYVEHSLQGNAVVAPRRDGDDETSVNLELLFSAVTEGRLDTGK